MTSTMDFPSGLRQAFDSLLRSSSKCVGKLNISRVSEKRYTQMKNAGIWTAYDSSQLRRFALQLIHSHSGATGVF